GRGPALEPPRPLGGPPPRRRPAGQPQEQPRDLRPQVHPDDNGHGQRRRRRQRRQPPVQLVLRDVQQPEVRGGTRQQRPDRRRRVRQRGREPVPRQQLPEQPHQPRRRGRGGDRR